MMPLLLRIARYWNSGDEDKASVEEDDEKEEEVFVSLVFCTKK